MPYFEVPIPVKGLSEGLSVHQEQGFSGHLLNVRPRDTLENRIRIGQRPSMRQAYTEQIGGATSIVQLFSITTVD